MGSMVSWVRMEPMAETVATVGLTAWVKGIRGECQDPVVRRHAVVQVAKAVGAERQTALVALGPMDV